MSKVMPAKPGWWWFKKKYYASADIAYVFEHRPGELWCTLPHGEKEELRVSEIEWLAPVPSVEAVQAAVDAIQFVLKAESLSMVAMSKLNTAIAGLTGEGE